MYNKYNNFVKSHYRIDFEKFSLAQPTKQHNESAYYCERDEFMLFTKDNNRIKVPALCGENSGQHGKHDIIFVRVLNFET